MAQVIEMNVPRVDSKLFDIPAKESRQDITVIDVTFLAPRFQSPVHI